jgi:hypothetical protein
MWTERSLAARPTLAIYLAEAGGDAAMHRSHASGRDIDIFYFASDVNGRPLHGLPAMLHFRAMARPFAGQRERSGRVIKEPPPDARTSMPGETGPWCAPCLRIPGGRSAVDLHAPRSCRTLARRGRARGRALRDGEPGARHSSPAHGFAAARRPHARARVLRSARIARSAAATRARGAGSRSTGSTCARLTCSLRPARTRDRKGRLDEDR